MGWYRTSNKRNNVLHETNAAKYLKYRNVVRSVVADESAECVGGSCGVIAQREHFLASSRGVD
jgi:hypothetical protein